MSPGPTQDRVLMSKKAFSMLLAAKLLPYFDYKSKNYSMIYFLIPYFYLKLD